MFTVGKHAVNRWAQWSETESACHDDDIAAFALGERPIRAVGTAHPNDLFATQPGNRATDGADCPHRVHDPALLSGVSTEADRHFAEPKHVQHVELAGDEAKGGSGCQLEGCYTHHLTADASDANRHRKGALGRRLSALFLGFTSVVVRRHLPVAEVSLATSSRKVPA